MENDSHNRANGCLVTRTQCILISSQLRVNILLFWLILFRFIVRGTRTGGRNQQKKGDYFRWPVVGRHALHLHVFRFNARMQIFNETLSSTETREDQSRVLSQVEAKAFTKEREQRKEVSVYLRK